MKSTTFPHAIHGADRLRHERGSRPRPSGTGNHNTAEPGRELEDRPARLSWALVGYLARGLEVVSSAIKIPLILGSGGGQLGDLNWLAAHRVRVALQTHAPFSAAVQAVYDTLRALREGVAPSELKNIASPELMRRGTRADAYHQWTKDFLGGA